MELLKEFLAYQLGFASIGRYLAALFSIILSMIIHSIMFSIFMHRFKKIAEKTKSKIDDMIIKAIENPLKFLFMLIGAFIACIILDLPIEPINIKKFVYLVLKSVLAVNVCWVLLNGTDVIAEIFGGLAEKTESKLDDQMVPLARKLVKVFIGLIAIVLIIQNLGYSVSSLLAGLGLGGLAFALAAKDTIANLFGSITIFIDRPFQIGDWIIVGDIEGTVEEVGFRSTKVRTFAKTQVSIPNSQIANMTINNISKRSQRRLDFDIGVTYETSAEKLDEAVNTIRDILDKHPKIDTSSLVYFNKFLDFSLNIMIYCFTDTTDWREYLRIRQEINLEIISRFEDIGVEMAYPTQVVHIYKENVDNQLESG